MALIEAYRSDNYKNHDIVYLDFSNAFDKVPEKRILRKINFHDRGAALKWTEVQLTNGKQNQGKRE